MSFDVQQFNEMKKKKNKKKRLDETVMGECLDCGEPCLLRDEFIVRPEIWTRAGITPRGGYLHQACLEKRLGRKLVTADFLVRYSGNNQMQVLDLPAYLAFNKAMGYQ